MAGGRLRKQELKEWLSNSKKKNQAPKPKFPGEFKCSIAEFYIDSNHKNNNNK